MKKTQSVAVRREQQPAEPLFGGERLKTELAFETTHQSYLWFTDRGRSRLIKH